MQEIEGFILTGGASSRMGRDKSRLELGGKTFVERAAIALSAIAPKSITLVGETNRQFAEINLPGGAALKLRVINDVLPEKRDAGANRPRAAIFGFYTALVRAETEWLAILACDLPFVSGELFERLIFLLQNYKSKIENPDAVVPVQPDGKAQPLCALYRRSACLSVVEEMLGGKDWSLQKLLQRVETLFVSFDEIADLPNSEFFFFNANTPKDFDKAQQIERLKKG